MFTLLSRFFVPAGPDSDPAVRRACGAPCGGMGIGLNLLLFVGKLLAGLLSGSIAVTADAFNNLSDAGSSLITLVGFRLAGRKPDPDHPFGHGRAEYLAGLLVSAAILVMGGELLLSSVRRLFGGEAPVFSLLTAVILAVSILVKLYMWFYNRAVGKRIDSAAMRAASKDSLSDTIATSVVLISLICSHLWSISVDGFAGIAVSLFILWSGFSSAKETVGLLLGRAPSAETVRTVRETVLRHPEVVGVHDMVIHDYGPGRLMISLHAEVPGDRDIYELHDLIDDIENELCGALSCEAVIHMDPVAVDDEAVRAARAKVDAAVRAVDPALSIHDFRMVPGPTHTNLIFDVLAPFSCRLTDDEIALGVREAVKRVDPAWNAVVKVDKDYLGEAK